MWSLTSWFLFRFTAFGNHISRQLELECYTDKSRLYDETHKILIRECCLYAHGSLFGLLYLTSSISRCIQKQIELEWCIRKPRMYDETHPIQLASITKCGLYAHGSLFGLLYLTSSISRCIQKQIELERCIRKPRIYYETHLIQLASITKCGLYTHGSLFTLLYLRINISRCIQKLEWYTHKPGMYNETHQIQIILITHCGLYVHGSLFALYTVFGYQYQ